MNEKGATIKNSDKVRSQIETVATCIWKHEIRKWTQSANWRKEKKKHWEIANFRQNMQISISCLLTSDKDNELFFFPCWIQENHIFYVRDVSLIVWPEFLHFSSHSLCSLSASGWLKNFSRRLSLFYAWALCYHTTSTALFSWWPNR